MVIGSIYLGMGNQMFQYAASRAVSLRLSTDLYLNLRYFRKRNGPDHRGYSLDKFTIHAHEASPLQIFPLSDGVQSVRKKLFSSYSSGYYKEPSPTYDSAILNVNGNVRTVGLFQSEKYFADYTDVIRKDFSLKEPLPDTFQPVLDNMRGTQSVSIHIRRGDYAYSNPYNYILPLEYYHHAIKIIKAKIQNPVFFVFSDDPAWVVENLSIGNSAIVSGKGTADYHELVLMSRCKHHIIANSTFSWWGAWLNPNLEKIVIAPQDWYSRQKMAEAPDLILDTWVKV
jgi:hypothetical protein